MTEPFHLHRFRFQLYCRTIAMMACLAFFSSWVQNSLNRLSVIPLLAHYDPILNGYTMLYHYYPRNNPFLTHAYLICWAMSKFWRVPRAQLCRTLVIAARCTNMELILVISMCLDVHPRKVAAKSYDPISIYMYIYIYICSKNILYRLLSTYDSWDAPPSILPAEI